MTPGQLVRTLLGPRFFVPVGRLYRSVFVDLQRVSESFPALPKGASLLEIGGGDGQMLNLLLARYDDARATMIDISAQLGSALDADVRNRVEVLPNTSIRDYAALGRPSPDLIAVCDVVHHVPPGMRAGFFQDLRLVMGPRTTLVIKDLRPGTARAQLSYLADRYVSGDKNVSLIGEAELERLVEDALPGLRARRTDLIEYDAPNYSIVFTRVA